MKKIYKIEEFILDAQTRQVLYQNKSISLSSRAFDILLYLVQKQGEIIGKEELIEAVWSDSFVEENNLAVHISALRRVLREKRGESKFIKTISGRGYSFIAPIREIKSSHETIKAAEHDESVDHNTIDSRISLAVLPLAYESLNPDFEYLANGITQSLIDDLARIPNLKVMAYSAVKNYKNSSLELQEIGFLLGVDKILTGEILKYKDSFNISLELLNSSDKRYIWGDQYNFEFEDIFRVKKQISFAVAENLKLQLSVNYKSRLERQESLNSEAYKIYLKGKYILETISTRRDIEKDLNQALIFFQQALKIDSNYALAYTGVGETYFSLFNHNLVDKTTALTGAKTVLKSALELDEDLSEAYVLKGIIEIIFERNLTQAKKSLNYAVKLNLNNSEAYHWLSFICVCLENFDEAFSLQNKSIELAPTSIPFNDSLLRVFYFCRQYNKAIVQGETILELNDVSIAAHVFLALTFAQLNFFDKAFNHVQKTIELRPTPTNKLVKAYVCALAKNKLEANEILEQVKQAKEQPDYVSIAAVYSALNKIDQAFFYLNKSYEEGSADTSFLRSDPRFENLRNDKRFKILLRNLKLI